jgi:hypothetical protein
LKNMVEFLSSNPRTGSLTTPLLEAGFLDVEIVTLMNDAGRRLKEAGNNLLSRGVRLVDIPYELRRRDAFPRGYESRESKRRKPQTQGENLKLLGVATPKEAAGLSPALLLLHIQRLVNAAAEEQISTMLQNPNIILQNHLLETGYAFIDSSSFSCPSKVEFERSWPELQASWNDLGEDTYVVSEDGQPTGERMRRFGEGIYKPVTNIIERLPHGPFVQSLDTEVGVYNRPRNFEPIKSETWNNPLFQNLFRTDMERFPLPKGRDIKIIAHQYRVQAGADKIGRPTPENSHRDGFPYITTYLIGKKNCKGGETILTDDRERVIKKLTLQRPLDWVGISEQDHPNIYHEVTPVEPMDPEQPAYRDTLVVNYIPL